MGEGDEVPGWIFYADFAGTVKGGALRHVDFRSDHRGFDGFEIFNFEVEESSTLADVRSDCGQILIHAGVGLVHHLRGTLLQREENELVAVGDFDGLDEPEMLGPKRQNCLNLFDEQNRRKFFDGPEESSCGRVLV